MRTYISHPLSALRMLRGPHWFKTATWIGVLVNQSQIHSKDKKSTSHAKQFHVICWPQIWLLSQLPCSGESDHRLKGHQDATSVLSDRYQHFFGCTYLQIMAWSLSSCCSCPKIEIWTSQVQNTYTLPIVTYNVQKVGTKIGRFSWDWDMFVLHWKTMVQRKPFTKLVSKQWLLTNLSNWISSYVKKPF